MPDIDRRTGPILLILAGLFGAWAVAAGAYAAHGLTAAMGPELAERAVSLWTTASHYQMVHAVMLAVVAELRQRAERYGKLLTAAGSCFAVGCLLFPGALYGLGWWGPSLLGAVAPVGGLSLVLGWLLLCVAGFQYAGQSR